METGHPPGVLVFSVNLCEEKQGRGRPHTGTETFQSLEDPGIRLAYPDIPLLRMQSSPPG